MANIALITNNILSDSGTALTSVLSGSGTTNYLSKFTGSTALGNSLVYDDGTFVGIGTTTPTYKLTVQDTSNTGTIAIGNTTYPGLIFSNAGTGEFRIDNRTSAGAGYITFYPNGQAGSLGTLAMKIATTGNILINTATDAGFKLDVNGQGRFSGGIVSERTIDALSGLFLRSNIDGSSILNNGIILGKSTSSNDAASIVYTHVSNGSSSNRLGLGFWNADNLLNLTASGNVGIGTTSPQTKLQVSGTVGYGSIRIAPSSTNGESAIGFFLDAAGTTTNSSWVVGQGGWGNTGKFVIGNENSGAGGNVRFTIEKTGEVGIGTTSPGYKLQVSGESMAVLNPNSPSSLSGADATLYLGGAAVPAYIKAMPCDWYAQNYRLEIGTQASTTAQKTYITFATEGAERMRIASTGNVLINTTTDAGYKLDVNGTARVSGNATNGAPFFSLNATSANNTFNWVSTAFASNLASGNNLIHFIGQSGSTKNAAYLGFKYSGSGSNDNILTLGLYGVDNVLNINGSGNVGIGTASPTEKLDIVGNVRIRSNSGIYYDTTGATASNYIGITNDYWTTLTCGRGYSASINLTNGNGILFNANGTEAMRIEVSNNVLIGTTTDAGYKLDVVGGGRFSSNIYAGTSGSSDRGLYVGSSGNEASFLYNATTGNLDISPRSGYYTNIKSGLTLGTTYGTGIYPLYAGAATFSSLSGSGTRMVVADSAGTLSTQSIPGGVSGSGTTSYVPKWTSSSALGNSLLYDDGTNIGIGTTNPTGQMSGTTGLGIFHASYPALGLRNASYQWLNYLDGSYYKLWNAGAGDVMSITYGGNVLIGTVTDPGYKLYVNGGTLLSSGTTGNSVVIEGPSGRYLQFGTDASGQYIEQTGTSSATRILRIQNSNGSGTYTQLFLNGANQTIYTSSNVNVGIGTSSPSAKLSVIGQGTGTALIGDPGFGSGNYTAISLNGSLTTVNYNILSSPTDSTLYINRPSGVAIRFRESNGTDQMIIQSGGNVGIGTTSVGVKFVNSGGGNSSAPTLGSGTVGSQALLAGNGLYGMYSGVSNSGDVWHQVQRNDGNTSVYNLLFQPSGGNVLIGTTTDAGFKLDVNGDIRTQTGYIRGANSDADIRLDGSVGSQLRYGGQKVLLNSADAYIYTANTARLYINNAGNVGIGTTSPLHKLEVAGNISINGGNYLDFANGDVRLVNSSGLLSVQTYSIATGLTTKMVVTGAGNVGIGTTSPLVALDVRGTVIITNQAGGNYNENLRLPESTSGYASLTLGGSIAASGTSAAQWTLVKFPTTNNFSIRNNNSDYVTVFPTGNFAIGNSTDAGYKLDVVNGAIRIVYSTFAGIEYHNTAGTWEGYIGTESGSGNLRYNSRQGAHTWYANSAANMTLTAAGNLGIGTTSPAYKLQVAGDIGFTAGANRYIRLANPAASGSANHIIIQGASANTSGTGGNIYLYEGSGAGGPGPGSIYIGATTGWTTTYITGQATISSTGPTTGTVFQVNAGGQNGLTINWNNTTPFMGYGLVVNRQSRFYNSSSYTFDNNLIVGSNTNSGEKLQVNGSGNFNLGNSGYIKLQSGSGQRHGFVQSAYSNFLFSNNIYYDGSNWRYDQNGYGAQIQTETLSVGVIAFNTFASGTAGNVATIIESMRIVNNGNILMGTTSDSGHKLQVNGTSKFTDSIYLTGTNRFIASGSSSQNVALYGGSAYSDGAYFNLTGNTYGASPGSGSAEFVIRTNSDSKFAMFGYNGSSWARYMTLFGPTGNMNIGYGTSDNGYKFTVQGDAYVEGNFRADGAGYFQNAIIQNYFAFNYNAIGGITSYQSSYNLYTFGNGNYSGDTIDGVLATSVSAGQIVFLSTSAQLWDLATGSSVGAAATNIVGIACAGGNYGDTVPILLNGFFASNSWYNTSSQYGMPMYLSTAVGQATTTAPSSTGNVVRILGHVMEHGNANGCAVMRFNPDNSWLVI